MANFVLIESLAKTAEQSYTPRELELIKKGIRIGAKHHVEINKNDDEWYQKRDQRREDSKERGSKFVGGIMNFIIPKDARYMTYQDIRDEVLKKLMNALVEDEDKCNEYFEAIKTIREQNKQLNSRTS